MAVVNDLECKKEIKDKVKAYLHPGYPYKRILAVVILLLFAGVTWFAVHTVTNMIARNTYNNAVNLLQDGKYEQGKVLLEKLGDYKNAPALREQIRYESIAYNCIDALKQKLKNPDSYMPYEIEFYRSLDADGKPVCFMHYGAQDVFSGLVDEYAIFEYSKDTGRYFYFGEFDSSEDINFLNIPEHRPEISQDRVKQEIQRYENAENIGDIDMQRIETVLKNGTYASIPIMD